MEEHIAPPDPDAVRRVVQSALAEDRARQDVTTRITVAPDQRGRGTFLAKQRGVVCGLDVVREVFGQMSPDLALTVHAPDGVAVEAGDVVPEVAGPLAAMLSGERVALNLLQRMSGTATMARAFVERAAEGGAAEITDTRKTTPGLRELERYAVRVGGARNHRDTLADGILINAILLDNMTPTEMAAVAAEIGDRVILEASGGITLDTVREVAATGVHLISVGALTHSAPALDISLRIEPVGGEA